MAMKGAVAFRAPANRLGCIGSSPRAHVLPPDRRLPGPVIALLRQLLLLCWLAALVGGGAQAQPTANRNAAPAVVERAVSHWTRAQVSTWSALLQRHSSEGPDLLELRPDLAPPEAAAQWSPALLPDVRARVPTAQAQAPDQVELRWYRTQLPAGSHAPLALYGPRFVGLSVSVLARGPGEPWRVLLHHQSQERDRRALPLWVPLPTAGETGQEILLAVPVAASGSFAVPRLWVAPKDELLPEWEFRYWMQHTAPQAISLTLAVLAMFALLMWMRHRAETSYLLFSLAAFGWVARNLHHYIDPPTQATLRAWYWWMTDASLGWVLFLALLYSLRFAKASSKTLISVLFAGVLLETLLNLPFWVRQADTLVLAYAITAVVGFVGAARLLQLAWRERREELVVMTVTWGLCLPLGVHDLCVLAGWAWAEHVYLMPATALVVVLGFFYAVLRRYAGKVEEAMFENSQLQISLDVQVDAYQVQNERLREAERQQALLIERQRLMADMHDGLGSSLLSALVAVEQGNMNQEQVTEVLRECVDDLRLVIDSLEPVGHDLVSLLATMRYRLGKRLQLSGLKLEWDVHDLPALPWLEPPDALHVLRLLQEALNNIVKHAHARRVRFVTRDHSSYVEIRVEDDGNGFDIETVRHGRGLKSQIKRAKKLGGKLRVESSVGVGTRVSLRLPLERAAARPDQQDPGPSLHSGFTGQ